MIKRSTSYRPARIHAGLGDLFYTAVSPAHFPEMKLRFRNPYWAAQVGLADLGDDQWCAHFGRFEPLPDNLKEALALKYHGHQFRHYNPDIGDGRGFLFGQVYDEVGRLLDLGTKGSGQTPFSRGGDGRLTLKGAVREILASELLEARGVNTSKSFSVIETGEALIRQDEPSPTRSAVLVRLSHSHIRFGTFQYLAFHGEYEAMGRLIAHCVAHYYPDLLNLEGDQRLVAFYNRVIEKSAELAAQWMAAGFVHGVLNSDNMNITGESFDYGPWRFLPHLDLGFTAAYFDHQGLYAYGRQPEAVGWNLAQLGGALLGALKDEKSGADRLNESLSHYGILLEQAMARNFSRRFGVRDFPAALIGPLFKFLSDRLMSLEQVFFDWYGGVISAERAHNNPYKEFYRDTDWRVFEAALGNAVPQAHERLDHAYFLRPRPIDMVIEKVESLWQTIDAEDNWEPLGKIISEMREMGQIFNK